MSRKDRFQAKDKIIHKMTGDGLIEINETKGETKLVSQRGQDFNLQQGQPERSGDITGGAVHIRRQETARAEETYSQVGNMSEPKTIRIRKSGEYHRHGKQPFISENAQRPAKTATEQPRPTPPTERQQAQNPRKLRHNAADSATPETGRPSDEQSWSRLRFDDSEQATPHKKRAQRGTQYSRRFSEDAEKPVETPTAENVKEDARDAPPSEVSDPSKTSKLQFAPEESAPPKNRKLEKAQKKLPKKRRIKLDQTVDAGTGKPKRRLHFESEVKSRRAHLKGPLPLRPVKFGAKAAIGYGHKKIHQVEQENVGVQAAHKGELLAERAVRSALRFRKTRPYRRVAKLEHKSMKANIKLSYRQALEDNPKLKSNLLSRAMQKRKIKRQYAKAAREAKRAARRVKKSGDAAKGITGFIRRHPMIAGVLALLLLVVFFFSTLITSCSSMAGGGFTSVIMSSYTSEDEDLLAVEAAYVQLEAELEEEINNIPNKYPGMDEYRYQLDYIGHDPHELAAYLTAVFQTYTLADVGGELQVVFDLQYELTIVEVVETRYREITQIDPDTGQIVTITIPYEYKILTVTLKNNTVGYAAQTALTAQQLEMYGIYRETKGNKPLLFGGGSSDYSQSADLSGVQFVDGKRPGNMDAVNIALSQVGNVGGQPYWSWYGFNSRVEWCACFVSWCINQAGYSEPRFAGCTSGGMGWFSSHGQWADRNYADIAPGDLIFFDWDSSGDADHVGMVIGMDSTHVYTVEGNSGDACRVRSYPLGSSVIRGYGLMNW